jgi:hypothetical protein
MNFGDALAQLKAGEHIARAGWNGKGMYLYLVVDVLHACPDDYKALFSAAQGSDTHFEPCIVMYTAQQKHQPGWLASQADMLAEDWEVVGGVDAVE